MCHLRRMNMALATCKLEMSCDIEPLIAMGAAFLCIIFMIILTEIPLSHQSTLLLF